MEGKEIIINGEKFKFIVDCDCSEFGDSFQTIFFKDMIKKTRKKYFFFGKLITEFEPKILFTMPINIEATYYTKYQILDKVRYAHERYLGLLNRAEEIANGEII